MVRPAPASGVSWPSRIPTISETGSVPSRRATNVSTARRPVIQPLRVVRDREEPGIPRFFGQEVQRPEADEEQVRGFRVGDAERGSERVALRIGQPIDSVEDRSEELVETGEREMALGLHARRPQDLHPAFSRGSLRFDEERGLPDAGRTTHEQRTTGAEEVADRVDLTLPTHEGWGGHRSHPPP